MAGKGQRSRTDAKRGMNRLPAGVIIYLIWALGVGIWGFWKIGGALYLYLRYSNTTLLFNALVYAGVEMAYIHR